MRTIQPTEDHGANGRPFPVEMSRYVLHSLNTIALPPRSDILDLACGTGRHAAAFARRGHRVTALDLDLSRLKHVCALVAPFVSPGLVAPICADASVNLPFCDYAFDLVLVVHYVDHGLTHRISSLIRQGGHLVMETYGGHGANWTTLPRPGQLRSELGRGFDLLDYRERLVGPTRTESASVKVVARKR